MHVLFGLSFSKHYLFKLHVSLTRYEVACCDGNISLHQCRISPVKKNTLSFTGFV